MIKKKARVKSRKKGAKAARRRKANGARPARRLTQDDAGAPRPSPDPDDTTYAGPRGR